MANQQFCLRWNNYQTNLTQVFDQLLQSESFVDVTLACEGHSLKAHRMVLSACSPYFQELLSDAPCSHPCIILQGVKWPELKAVVEFMYKGEININQDDLGSLLRVAEYLKIRGLAEVDGDPAETAVLTSPSISPAARALANALIDENPVSSVLAAARKRRRLSGGISEDLTSRPSSPLTPTSAPEIFEHAAALDLPGLPHHIRGGGSAPLPGSPAHFNSLPSPHLPGHMPPPQLPPHLPHLPHLPPLSPLLNMHSLPRPHLHDDFEIRPGIAEMIREEERRRRDAPDMAKLLESSHHWMGTSMADSYQAQVQAAWQKSWNQTQSLLQNLRFRERGPLKSWRPETMAEAIHAVLKEGLSLSQAARKYDIPYPTFVLYANRVHNLLGPSQEPGDLRPKGRGRPQRILLGSWPEEQIKGVIRAVVFRDTSVFKENEHKVGARTKVSTENKHPATPKLHRDDQAGLAAVRPNGPALPNISGSMPLFPPSTPDNGSFSTAPSTPAPNTPAPNTPAPSTPASSTPAPSTPVPTTPLPSTSVPGTQAPSTSAPNTPAPITSGPNTPPSSLAAPLTPSSAAPATSTSNLSLSEPSTPVPVPSTTPTATPSVAQPLTTPPTPGSTPISTAASPAGSPASSDSRITTNAAVENLSPAANGNINSANLTAQTSVSSSKLSPVFSLGSASSSTSNGNVASNGTPRDPSEGPSASQQNQTQTSQQQNQQKQQHQHQQQDSHQQRPQQPHLQHQHQYALQQQMQYQSQQPKAPHLQQSPRLPQQPPHLQMQQQQQMQQLSHQQRQQLHHQQQQAPHHQKQVPRQQLPSQHAQQRHSHASQNHQRQPQVPQIGGLLPTGLPPSLATSLNSQVHLARLFSESTAAAPHPYAGHQSQHPQAPISPFHPGFPRHPHPSAAMQVLNAMNNMNPHASRMNSEEPEPSPEALLFSKITNSHINPPHSSGESSARPSAVHNQFENLGDSSSSLSGLVERASMMYRDGLDSIKSEPEPILN